MVIRRAYRLISAGLDLVMTVGASRPSPGACQKLTTMSRRGLAACESEWLLAGAARAGGAIPSTVRYSLTLLDGSLAPNCKSASKPST
jgi:hypothetical protein